MHIIVLAENCLAPGTAQNLSSVKVLQVCVFVSYFTNASECCAEEECPCIGKCRRLHPGHSLMPSDGFHFSEYFTEFFQLERVRTVVGRCKQL